MTQYIITLAIAALVLSIVQLVKVRMLSYCAFGLSKTALVWQLKLWSFFRIRCAVIAIDIRKLHDMNSILGYSEANKLMADALKNVARSNDLIGQYGGDEHIIAIRNPQAWPLVLERFTANLRALTETMPIESRDALYRRTGGLVDGLHAAIVIVPETRRAYHTAMLAIDKTGEIKDGPQTGDRSTSGAKGTIIEVMEV